MVLPCNGTGWRIDMGEGRTRRGTAAAVERRNIKKNQDGDEDAIEGAA